MAEDDNEDTQSSSEDRIIDSRAFQLGGGVDLGAFISSDDLAEAKRPALPGGSPTDATAGTQEKVVVDENQDDAIGEIFEIFDQDSGPKAGDILPDGTVYDTPELDTITEVAVQGERRLHWALMVTMIVVYSLIGWPSDIGIHPRREMGSRQGNAHSRCYMGYHFDETSLWIGHRCASLGLD